MKRILLLALFSCLACGGGLVDHGGIDVRNPNLTCNLPLQNCGGATCAAMDTDPNNCGACGMICASPQNATGVCAESSCEFTCNPGFFRCSSQGACCPATALSAGGDTSCAIADGTVQCWGSNDSGQLGFNPIDAGWSGKPVDVPSIPAASSVAVGLRHVCAIAAGTGDVWCWGANDTGQLGDVTGRGPGKITGVTNASALALGDHHTCAITGTGAGAAAVCWGADDSGQIGRGSTSTTPRLPGTVTAISGVTSISAGSAFTCAVASTTGAAEVYCWGDGSLGQFGNGPASSSATPVRISDVSNPAVVACGASHACGLGSNFLCWGANASGQVGDGKQSTASQTSGPGVQSPVAISAGLAHTCAVSSAGAPFCWGANESGELGTGNTLGLSRPAAVSSLSGVQRLALGSRHSCTQLATGAVYCWGNNSNSQAGAPRGGTILTPRLIDGR